MRPAYVELQVTTNLSFLHGASAPEEYVLTAAALGHKAIGISDRNTRGGIVRLHAAAKNAGLRPVIGCRVDLLDAPSVLILPNRPCRIRSTLPVAHGGTPL